MWNDNPNFNFACFSDSYVGVVRDYGGKIVEKVGNIVM